MICSRKSERSVRWMLCAEWQSAHTGSSLPVCVTSGLWTLAVNSSKMPRWHCAQVRAMLARLTLERGSLQSRIKVPDGLGGWHVVQLVQKGRILAQMPFYVEESIVGRGVSSVVVKEGQPFTIHLEGVGWTQLDNTVTVDYDNSYIGYGCGFNSNGDV